MKQRNNYCVIRVLPDTTFIEAIGTKSACMKFAHGAAKPRLRVCKMVPVVKWDNSGKMKKIGELESKISELKKEIGK